MDQFDFVEDMQIRGDEQFHVLNVMSLHGHQVNSWVVDGKTSENAVSSMILHWRKFGFPDYAQFDNGLAFYGSRHPDSLGKVSRLCLSLGVTPVFAPPRTFGFQSSIESYNGRWGRSQWERFEFADIREVTNYSVAYVDRVRTKFAWRIFEAPTRWQVPDDWQLDYQNTVGGKVIYLRKTDGRACVNILGHACHVPLAGANHTIRAEVNLDDNVIDFYRLSRRHPNDHPYVGSVDYHFPRKPFKE